MARTPSKSRGDSVSNAVSRAQRVLHSKLSWPDEVPLPPESDLAITLFDRLSLVRDVSDWTLWDTVELARLCVLTVQQISDEALLSVEGSLVPNPTNPKYEMANPRLNAISTRQKSMTALARELGVSSAPDTRTLNRGGIAARKAREVVNKALADDLLA